MQVVMGICERIYVLDYGKLIAEGNSFRNTDNPKVIEAIWGWTTNVKNRKSTRILRRYTRAAGN